MASGQALRCSSKPFSSMEGAAKARFLDSSVRCKDEGDKQAVVLTNFPRLHRGQHEGERT